MAKNVFFGKSPGVSAFSRSASSIVGSFPVTPAVWMSRSICRTAASITSGAAWPMFRTAMPVEKSISRLPSTSSMIAPEARALTIGWIAGNADVMAPSRRAIHSFDFGPGIWVRTLRSCGMSTVRPPRSAVAR